MDLESSLKTHSDVHPSGENLEYEPEFTDMELAARPGEERQAGDNILAAEDPDYRDIVKKAEAIMAKTHDLRAGVFFAEATLRTEGLTGFSDATAYLLGCLEQYWDTCHPQLDNDDENDPTMRINSVQNLAGDTTVLRGLRLTPLTNSKSFGKLSFRDISISEGSITAPEGTESIPDSATVSAAFQDTDDELLDGLLAAVKSAAENVAKIDAIFDEKTPGRGPDLTELIKLLAKMVKRLANATGAEVEDTAGADDGVETAVLDSGGGVGGINSPSDVSNALDRIMAYYQRSEPSSPVPLLLKRAKRLVSADFMAIMMDMAPGGLQNVNLIGGIDDNE